MIGLRSTDNSKGWQPGSTSSRTVLLENVTTGLTDVVLTAHFLQYVNLLHRCLPDLFDLLLGQLVRGCDVDDLHRVLLGGALVDAAAHYAAHSPADRGHPRAGEGRKLWYIVPWKHASISPVVTSIYTFLPDQGTIVMLSFALVWFYWTNWATSPSSFLLLIVDGFSLSSLKLVSTLFHLFCQNWWKVKAGQTGWATWRTAEQLDVQWLCDLCLCVIT